jgi:hypothetical protein
MSDFPWGFAAHTFEKWYDAQVGDDDRTVTIRFAVDLLVGSEFVAQLTTEVLTDRVIIGLQLLPPIAKDLNASCSGGFFGVGSDGPPNRSAQVVLPEPLRGRPIEDAWQPSERPAQPRRTRARTGELDALSMDPRLARALAPVLRDLEATCDVTLELSDDWPEPPVDSPLFRPWHRSPELSVMVHEPSGSSTGISIEGGSLPEQIAALADQLQDVAVETLWRAGLPASWPACPTHPRTHPLEAHVTLARAAWRCPRTFAVVADIGDLVPS